MKEKSPGSGVEPDANSDEKLIKNDGKTAFRCGSVALLGRPNIGKSTLVNALVGMKVAITADKPQTTRHNIRGILTENNYQVILLDTPGIHSPHNLLHKRIINYSLQALNEADALFCLIEPRLDREGNFLDEDRAVMSHVKNSTKKAVLIVNKIDQYKPEEQEKFFLKLAEDGFFQTIIPVSALKKQNLKRVRNWFAENLPVGAPIFPEDDVTDTGIREICRELVREASFRMLKSELPYNMTVEIIDFQEYDGLVRIFVNIITTSESHKKIIIGKNGAMLKKIGFISRKKMQAMIAKIVYLDIRVKVVKKWNENPARLNEFGYN